ncbi:MAG: GNAT family N-acetyltransferase [Actinobacteria bacterium]|nr:GNAT family N-acetyltransferase [Actinomycetota bacterium]
MGALPEQAANDLLLHVGERLSVRVQSEQGHTDDLVGILLPTGQLETKAGVRTFDPAHVVAWRIVKPPRGTGVPMSQRILDIESASSELWAPTHQERTPRWHLRAAGGYTRRANSMIPIAPPWESKSWSGSSLDADLAEADRFYQAHDLPTIITLPMPLYEELAAILIAREWKLVLDISVMVRIDRNSVDESANAHLGQIEISTTPDASWMVAHGRALGNEGHSVLTSGTPRFLSYVLDGEVVGTARVGFARQWSALGAVRVNPKHRRKGIARALVERAINVAQDQGFPFMLLQVDCDNDAAITLYKSLGFTHHHRNIYLSRD